MNDDLADVRVRLDEVGQRYEEATAERTSAREELELLVREALTRGIPPTEVARLSRLSSESIRTARIAAGLPPFPRGGRR